MTDHEVIQNLHRRMDTQDALLKEIRDMVISHIATEKEIKPAVDELVAMWRGSKLIIPILASAGAMIWAVVAWAKDHVRL
jgi:hypothetical protein